jgi:hypothetical protein
LHREWVRDDNVTLIKDTPCSACAQRTLCLLERSPCSDRRSRFLTISLRIKQKLGASSLADLFSYSPPALRRPRGHLGSPTSQPVPGPWAVMLRAGPARSASLLPARIKADADRGSHLPATARPGTAHGTGAGGTGDAAEKMCFIFPIRHRAQHPRQPSTAWNQGTRQCCSVAEGAA